MSYTMNLGTLSSCSTGFILTYKDEQCHIKVTNAILLKCLIFSGGEKIGHIRQSFLSLKRKVCINVNGFQPATYISSLYKSRGEVWYQGGVYNYSFENGAHTIRDKDQIVVISSVNEAQIFGKNLTFEVSDRNDGLVFALVLVLAVYFSIQEGDP